MEKEKLYAGNTISFWAECVEMAFEMHEQCGVPLEECLEIPQEVAEDKEFWLGLCGESYLTGNFLYYYLPPKLLEDEEFIKQMIEISPDIKKGLNGEIDEEI